MKDVKQLAADIKLILTDVDGVLTDNGVFYSESGEVMKRFSIRDGMGIERLWKLCGIPTGIITGELSLSVARRAEKLAITELHLGVKDKLGRVSEIMERLSISWQQVAYIGDDVNDLEVMERVGIAACPEDAMAQVRAIADYVCGNKGGYGAFREFAEWMIVLRER